MWTLSRGSHRTQGLAGPAVTCHLRLVRFQGKAHSVIHARAARCTHFHKPATGGTRSEVATDSHEHGLCWRCSRATPSTQLPIHNPLHRRGRFCQLSITHSCFICSKGDLLDLLRYLWHSLQWAFPLLNPSLCGHQGPWINPLETSHCPKHCILRCHPCSEFTEIAFIPS